jgi:tight adherence protein B
VAAGLRAGSLPADALTAAARGAPDPLATVLQAAASAEALGVSAASVLARPAAGCEALAAVAVCWEVCIGAGAGLARTLDRLADVFSAELESAAAVDAELAGVRLSALVMACLPLLGLALGAALGSDPLHVLLGLPAGRVALAGAAVLDGCGLLWIGRLAASAAR